MASIHLYAYIQIHTELSTERRFTRGQQYRLRVDRGERGDPHHDWGGHPAPFPRAVHPQDGLVRGEGFIILHGLHVNYALVTSL